VNLLSIHDDLLGGGNAKAHFVASDFHQRETDIVANKDRFSSFPG